MKITKVGTELFTDESLFQGTQEFSTDTSERIRAINEDGVWGIYTQEKNDFVRCGAVAKHAGDTPRDIWERFNAQYREDAKESEDMETYYGIVEELQRIGVTGDHVGPVDAIVVTEEEDGAFKLYDDNADYRGDGKVILETLKTLENMAGWEAVWDAINQKRTINRSV